MFLTKTYTNYLGLINHKRELTSYAIIGLLTQVIDIVTYHLLVLIGVPYFVADILNNPLVLGFNYLGHKQSTFQTKNWELREILRYVATLVFNFFYSTLLLVVLVEVLHLDSLVAKLIQIVLLAMVNFLVLKRFVFKKNTNV
jgi:putative flippase GtrA